MITKTFKICLTLSMFILWPLIGLADDTQLREIEKQYVDPPVFHNPQLAAQHGLEELKKIEQLPSSQQEIYAKSLGFLSAQEILFAKLGVGLRVYDVSLDRLKELQISYDLDPVAFLTSTHEIIFPLLVDNQPRSSLTISELAPGKGWIVGKEGRSALIHLIESYRVSDDDNLIQIPSLGLRFLGKRNNVYGNELVLIPLVNQSKLEIQAGQPVLARDLFFALRGKVVAPHGGGQSRQPSIKQ